jgi:hypothetical protein
MNQRLAALQGQIADAASPEDRQDAGERVAIEISRWPDQSLIAGEPAKIARRITKDW